MAFELSIAHERLTDSVFGNSKQGVFSVTENESRDLENDLINGNETCYMISGYRGAGKSSFIKRLEVKVRSTNPERVFVYVNLSKHESHSIILRKLIRNFYLQLTENADNKEICKTVSNDPGTRKGFAELKKLYRHTYSDVSEQGSVKETNRFSSKIQLNKNELVLVGVAISVFIYYATKLQLAPMFASLLVGALPFLKQFGSEKKKELEKENYDHFLTKSLYDDEISEYRLQKIIRSLNTKIRPVFVIDELDKIQDVQVTERILNELKPMMLSGDATFIIIAGQQLYYHYYYAQTKEDNSISSIFSRTEHVRLMRTQDLKTLFSQLTKENILELGPANQKLLDEFLSKVIFQARNVPRSFISILRQKLVWRDGNAILEIKMPLHDTTPYAEILKNVEEYTSQEIVSRSYPPAIEDFMIMKVMIEVDKQLNTSLRRNG